MKSFQKLAIACLICVHGLAYSQTSLEVTVKNIKENKGSIRVGLFTSEKDFLKKAHAGKVIKVSGPEVKVIFENLPPGEYAVSIIHDENDNGELDSNFMGIPREGFAFGNNAMGSFGPPPFEKAKVKLDKDPVNQVISLRYF